MAEIEVIEEIALSLPEVRDILSRIKKRDKDVSAKGTKVLDYISKVNNMKEKEALELHKKLNELGVERLKQKSIAKIIDIQPRDIDSLKAILVGDNLTLKQEDLQYQRSEEGAASVLIHGQRAGIPSTDKWKSEKPLKSIWFLSYNPENRKIYSRIAVQRPLIQNRGLENIISLDENGNISSEELRGYFYKQDGWSEFIGAIPMFVLPVETVEPLAKGISEFSVKQQCDLEDSTQNIFLNCPSSEAEIQFENAVKTSFEKLREDQAFGYVWKFVLTEALYQHARRSINRDFIYSKEERMHAFELAKSQDVFAESIVKSQKLLDRLKRTKKRIEKSAQKHVLLKGDQAGVLDPNRLEYEDVRRFLEIRSQMEMLVYQLENGARFCDEAADRVCHVRNVVKQYAATPDSLESAVRQQTEENFDKVTLAAYGRIFTEFLGMISNNWEQLRLASSYKEKLLEKIRKFKPQQM